MTCSIQSSLSHDVQIDRKGKPSCGLAHRSNPMDGAADGSAHKAASAAEYWHFLAGNRPYRLLMLGEVGTPEFTCTSCSDCRWKERGGAHVGLSTDSKASASAWAPACASASAPPMMRTARRQTDSRTNALRAGRRVHEGHGGSILKLGGASHYHYDGP